MSDAIIPILVFLAFVLGWIGSGFYVASLTSDEPQRMTVITDYWAGQ